MKNFLRDDFLNYLDRELLAAMSGFPDIADYNHTLKSLFPLSGFSLFANGAVYKIFAVEPGSIKETFSAMCFTNEVVTMNSTYEKEYLSLTREEFEEIIEFIKDAKIIT